MGDRWTLLILRDLAWYGPARFGTFETHNQGIPPAVLSDRLSRLLDQELIEKPGEHYQLVGDGADVRALVDAVARFGGGLMDGHDLTKESLSYLTRRLTDAHRSHLSALAGHQIDFNVDGFGFGLAVTTTEIAVCQPSGSDTVNTSRQGFFALVSGRIALSDIDPDIDPETAPDWTDLLTALAA